MAIYDFVVVGGGVGGTLSALMLSNTGSKTLLIEKEPHLGGCSATFARGVFRYNVGATTFCILPNNENILKKYLEKLNLVKLEIPIIVIQNKKKIFRYSNIEIFIQHLNEIYPSKNHRKFWIDIYELATLFIQKSNLYFNKSNPLEFFKSVCSVSKVGFSFAKPILKNAKTALYEYFPDMNDDLYDFLENQFLIVAQTKIENANFLTLALALSYPFFDNFYAVGGMGEIFKILEDDIFETKKNTTFLTCLKKDNLFSIQTTSGEFLAKKVIFNTQYENNFIQKNNLDQSAFVVYGVVKSDQNFGHHYQILASQNLSFSISNSIFVSFSDKNDRKMAPQNHFSFTISIHTKASFWKNIDAQQYKLQKKQLQDEIVSLLCNNLNINSSQLLKLFSATPITFERYICRSVLGGMPLESKNFLFKFGSPKVGDFYYCGDNVFPAQGWPGILNGVENLKKVLNV